MNRFRIALISAAVVATVSPAAAFASTYWHNGAGELSADTVPEHFASRSAAQVRAELDRARSDGTLRATQSGGTVEQRATTGRAASRTEVLRDLKATTPAERNALRDIYVGG